MSSDDVARVQQIAGSSGAMQPAWAGSYQAMMK